MECHLLIVILHNDFFNLIFNRKIIFSYVNMERRYKEKTPCGNALSPHLCLKLILFVFVIVFEHGIECELWIVFSRTKYGNPFPKIWRVSEKKCKLVQRIWRRQFKKEAAICSIPNQLKKKINQWNLSYTNKVIEIRYECIKFNHPVFTNSNIWL